ncbi:hypothetical protein ACJJTC_005116 [Scirpophaga incertulas]
MKCEGCSTVINDSNGFQCCHLQCNKNIFRFSKCDVKEEGFDTKYLDTPYSHNYTSGTSAVSEVSELTSEIRLLTQEILSLKDKLESATTSLDKCHKRLDELAETITKSETRINKLEKSERMVNSMLLTINKLQTEIDTQAQNNVRNEIEIIGVPEVRNESLMHIVMSAAKKIGDANKSVFINERLTNHTRLLFRESRTRSKEHGFTYCWIKNGFIYVRQQDGSPAQCIRNQDDLLRIFPINNELSIDS